MHRISFRWVVGCCFVILLGVSAAVSPANALSCPQPQPPVSCPGVAPICQAKPTSSVCSNDASRACVVTADCNGPGTCVAAASIGVGGTVSAHPGAITAVTLTGASNVTLTVSSLPSGLVTFRAFQTNPAVNGDAVVVATDGAQTCTVPVSFRIRAAGVPASELLCPLAENYSVEVFSGPSSPAGTTACSSHLAACDPTLPNVFLAGDSRVVSVRSPIAGTPVLTDLIRGGAFDPNLRLLFARSTDSGLSYSPYADVTTTVLSGSTRIRGTTQWSDVRMFAASDPIGCVDNAALTTPTMGEWAMILLTLLMATASTVLLARRRFASAGPGPAEHTGPPLFVPRLFLRALAGSAALTLAGLAAFAALDLTPSATDVGGSLACAAVLAYLVHLWIAQSADSSGS